MAIFESLGKYRNTGLLILRVGIGIAFMIHGFPKISGGVEMWTGVGQSMKHLGINFMPEVWGFLAAAAETFGGVLLVLGLFFRPACIALAVTMGVAATMHFSQGDGYNGASHALDLAIVVFSLIFIGPGKYSIDKK